MERQIVLNRIMTPDGTILESRSVHDYKVYEDKNKHQYMVDGGNDYLRRNVIHEAPYTEMSLYADDSHEVIRAVFTWGTYGKNGDEPYQLKLVKDLTVNHIKAILETHLHTREYMRQIFKNELKYREREATRIPNL